LNFQFYSVKGSNLVWDSESGAIPIPIAIGIVFELAGLASATNETAGAKEF